MLLSRYLQCSYILTAHHIEDQGYLSLVTIYEEISDKLDWYQMHLIPKNVSLKWYFIYRISFLIQSKCHVLEFDLRHKIIPMLKWFHEFPTALLCQEKTVSSFLLLYQPLLLYHQFWSFSFVLKWLQAIKIILNCVYEICIELNNLKDAKIPHCNKPSNTSF